MLPQIIYFIQLKQIKLHQKEKNKTSVKFIEENVIRVINVVWDKQPAI